MILTVNLWDQLGIWQNKFNKCRFCKDFLGVRTYLEDWGLGDSVCGSSVDEKEGINAFVSLIFFSVKIIYFA